MVQGRTSKDFNPKKARKRKYKGPKKYGVKQKIIKYYMGKPHYYSKKKATEVAGKIIGAKYAHRG